MALKIKKQLVSSRKYTYSGKNGKRFIVVHQTDNWQVGANAQAHANLQSNGNTRDASWHWQVDDKQAIQSFPHDVRCWQAGDGKATNGGNYNGISIEICLNRDGNYVKAMENAAKLVRKIMKDEGIALVNVKQHNFFSGKNCPSEIRRGRDGITWPKFIEMIAKVENPPQSKPSKPSKPATNLYRVRKSWSDAKSQKGAYSVLANAKAEADKHKGYSVYDSNGKVVYKGKAAQPAKPSKPTKPSKPKANLAVDGSLGPATIRALQAYFGTPVDGKLSKPSMVVKALQKWLGTTQDGYISEPYSNAVAALQRKFGTKVDGRISKPKSLVIMELQRRLNAGNLDKPAK